MNTQTAISAKQQVSANLKYLASKKADAAYVVNPGKSNTTEHVGDFEHRCVAIANARMVNKPFSLDNEGFCLMQQSSSVKDFYDDEQIQKLYDPEITTLIKQVTGGSHVEIFDHTRRSSSGSIRETKHVREPASVIHNDFTASSGIMRLQHHYKDRTTELTTLQHKRMAIVNVWRSIKGIVHHSPLAMCDARSVAPEDLIDIVRESEERKGELQMPLFNDAHRWYYYPRMTMDEALLIKTFDTSTEGQSRFTIHTAFEDGLAPENASPRESLETRCFVFFD